MTSHSIDPSTFNLRSKGAISHAGKLHKGCVKDATTKLSIGSIPSTYESIIYKTDCKKAFGTSEKRFYDKETGASQQNHNHEDLSTLDSCTSQTKVNHNRLGQNAFISKQKREWFRCARTPGPTHYSNGLSDQSRRPRPRKCFTSQLCKKQQAQANPQKNENIKELASPGPGEYIQDRKQFWSTTSKGWKSSFESKIERDGYIPQSISPGPGYYQLLTKTRQKLKIQGELKIQKRLDEKRFISQVLKQKNENELGPCTYNQQIPSFKPLYERIKLSKNFMAPTFTGKKKSKGVPGPTAYPVKRMYEDIKPKLIESTCFMSESKREPFNVKDWVQPTTQIEPKLLGHKNFHFNIKNEWMC